MRLLLALLIAWPLAAQGAQAASPPAHGIALAWTYPATGTTATSFTIQRATVSGGPYTTIATTPNATTLTYLDPASGLVDGTKYFYVVLAVGPGGTSPPSNEASATFFVAPGGLTAVPQ